MKARYPGKCSRTGKSYGAGTEIEKHGRGWAIKGATLEAIEVEGARVMVGPVQYGGNDDDSIDECEITVELEGQTFKYFARNIFDFGLAINPEFGGLAINVEQFARNNYLKDDIADSEWQSIFEGNQNSPIKIFGVQYADAKTWEEFKERVTAGARADAEAYRAAHPTKSGWGWDRYWISEDKGGEKWQPMSEIEVRAYEIAQNHVPGALRGIRM